MNNKKYSTEELIFCILGALFIAWVAKTKKEEKRLEKKRRKLKKRSLYLEMELERQKKKFWKMASYLSFILSLLIWFA